MLALAACNRSKPTSIRLVTFSGAEAPLLAQKLNYFAEAGLDVDLQETPGTAKAMEALLGGSADSIVGTYEQALQLQAKGQRVVGYRLLTECHCLALVAPPSKPEIQKIEDLDGKTVGVGAPGGSMQTFVSFLLDRAHAGEASYVGIGVGASAFAAIEGGKVDAAVVLASTLTRLRERYPNLRVLAETFSEEGSQRALGVIRYPSMAVLAKGEWLDQNAATAQRVSAALGRAVDWIHAHPAEEVRQRLGGNLDLASLKLHLPRYSRSGHFEYGAAGFVLGQLERARKVEQGAIRSLEATYTNDYVKRNPAP